MTQAQQTEARRLAGVLRGKKELFIEPIANELEAAAAELERQATRIVELEQGKCLHQIAEPAQRPDAHAKAAIATLTSLGYTWIGGELWKSPIGKAPDFNLLDAMHARIAELESQLEAIGAGGVEPLRKQVVQPAVPVEVVTDLKNALADATEIRQQLRLMEEHARGDVWRWQADAANELASMGNRMGVLILASDLRNLLAAPAHPAEGVNPVEMSHAQSIAQQAQSWVEVFSLLRKVVPNLTSLAETGEQCALAAIRELAATQPAAQGLDAQHVEAVLLEHSGCGHNTQVDQLTVRLNPGDKVVLRKGRITQGYEKANAALAAQAKQGGA